MESKKVTLNMRVSVHPIQAKLWEQRNIITSKMTLREIGNLVGVESPQQIKHHLEALRKIGAIDYVGGEYIFPKKELDGRDDDVVLPHPPKPNGKMRNKVDPHIYS